MSKQGKITNALLPDMQQTTDGFYKKRIAKVGVRNIIQTLPVITKEGSIQSVVATISSYCDLQEGIKGINMSKIARTINDILHKPPPNGYVSLLLKEFVRELVKNHQSQDAYIKVSFTYILDEKTPMSGLYSQEPIDITIESFYKNNEYGTYLTVKTVAMSLCPCSKEMSLLKNNLLLEEWAYLFDCKNISKKLQEKLLNAGFGAHNQRSHINVTVGLDERLPIPYIEDIYEISKKASSCSTRSVLKREDEKFVTEVSYMGGYFDDDKEFIEVGGGPRFVEDIARGVAEQLDTELDKTINDYVIVVSNDESIHSGGIQAVAVLNAGRNLK